RDFGVRPTDMHRPMVDELVRPNPDDPTGRSMMRRVPEVLDCWFESGSMPFAQVHYPFENADWFEHHYPGDFIVEYIGQTRGWFYTLHVLATALFDKPAFDTCVVHGILLGSDGRKMSKSLRNYPDVTEVFDRDGSDAMRWFLMSSPVLRGGELVVTEAGIREGVRQVIKPLWNAWHFFALYANAAGGPGNNGGYDARWRTDSPHVLDRYVLAKTHDLVLTLTEQLDQYDVSGACTSVREHLETLTNWYIRRSRQRFWDAEPAAFDTLYSVLQVLTRLAAPLLPLTTESVFRGLTGERSVHLTDWPAPDELPGDDGLVAAMDAVRDVCSATLGLRKAAHLRVRLPLAKLTVATEHAADLAPFVDLVRGEVNVKDVVLTTEAESGLAVQRVLHVNPRVLGPRLGKDVQTVIKACKSGDWSVAPDGAVTVGGFALTEGEYDVELSLAGATDGSAVTATLPTGGFVVLDTEVTPELAAEGIARDVVRAVQQARRDAGLHISDRIRLGVDGDAEALTAVDEHRDMVAGETLATEVVIGAVPAERAAEVQVGDGLAVRLTVEKSA
ncbi:MAG TPA: class I tRNA ligase family protein, partial [Actinomycetes bacterium]|nr:class I tRNA ligase family protein [Actinomycetes bacterium]